MTALLPAGCESDRLRADTEEICAQLCGAVTGDFDFRVGTGSGDETVQKLTMLANFVLDAARRAVEAAAARAAAETRAAELRDVHRIARIATFQCDLAGSVVALSDEMHLLLGTVPAGGPLSWAELLARLHPDDRDPIAAALTVAASGLDRGGLECRLMQTDGAMARLWVELRLERDARGRPTAIRGVCQDVTEHRTAAERIEKLTHYDPLTGLANRTLLQLRLSDAIGTARQAGGTLAVLCINLDGFRAVNDLHGHATGDRLLCEVAARLRHCVRDTDVVARLGADEFVVIQLHDVQPEAARALADRLLERLAEPYCLAGGEDQGTVTASFGIALYPSDGDHPDTLLHNADTALHRAKWAGGRTAFLYRPEMDRELRERRALERDLHHAASRGEFKLVWQPIAASATGNEVHGFEALLRWHHPERGLVPPDVFIPIAEACGAIASIGAWVMQEACHEAARWRKPLRIAVNVSPLQVQEGRPFAEMVEQALLHSGLHPSRLMLEVTEGVLIRETERVLATLNRLKSHGVRVGLDDFGTGYSSLATLRAFPFDKIKIDRSFVADLVTMDGQDAAIVRAVLGLARGLGLPVIAEGVETPTQLALLRAMGCEEVQGWLIGRPAAIATFAHLTDAMTAAAA